MNTIELFSRIKNLPLTSLKLIEGILSGNYRSVFRGPGLEFDEVREYVEGDDSRFIDWNVSSRIGAPYTKTFREERELVLFLLVDVSASLGSAAGIVNKRETGTILSSLLAFAAIYNNDMVGAVFFSDTIEKWVPPRKGKNQVFRLVDDMMTFQAAGTGSDLGLAIKTVQETLKGRGICVIVSDFRVPPCWKELTILAKKHDVIALKVTDPSEWEFPVPGLVELKDPETGQTSTALGGSQKFRKEYREFWETHHIFWERECRRRGISTLTIDTQDDPVQKLMLFFDRRKRK